MNNYLIIDAISYLDADILAKHLEKKEKIRNKAKIKKKVNVLRWSVVAACLFFAIVLSAITIPYIPTKYNLNYSYVGESGKEIFIPDSNIWIYYVDNSKIERKRVKLPSSPQNVFLTWKHLNNIGEVVSLIKCEVISDGVESVLTYDGKTVYEYGGNSVLVLNIIVSENLNDYIDESNRELVVDSLKKSITNCSNLKFKSVNLILQETD